MVERLYLLKPSCDLSESWDRGAGNYGRSRRRKKEKKKRRNLINGDDERSNRQAFNFQQHREWDTNRSNRKSNLYLGARKRLHDSVKRSDLKFGKIKAP